MIRVKVAHRFRDHPFLRQTPGGSGRWGDCAFFINEDVKECDWFVVYEGISENVTCRCPPESTILFTGEPPDIKRYPAGYTRQFATVVTCQRALEHPNLIFAQQALPWHAGMRMITRTGGPAVKGYDDFARAELPQKTKLMSMFCSDKEAIPGHRARRAFARKLADHFQHRLELFGKGSRFVEDKWDGMAPYRYHVVIENSQVADYWTEKLADCYLAGAYPFYCGCPNITDYFPAGALTAIDVNDPDRAIEAIHTAIERRTFERSATDLKRARDLVLNRYNFFPTVVSLIERLRVPTSAPQELVIRPEAHFRAEEYAAANVGWASEIRAVVPPGERIILVDEGCSLLARHLPQHELIPFPERDGQYGGVPADDAAALDELDRLRRSGARFFMLIADTFWWMDHFARLASYLRGSFPCALHNERLVIFDLRSRLGGGEQ